MDLWTVKPWWTRFYQMDQVCKGIGGPGEPSKPGGPGGPVAPNKDKNSMCLNTLYYMYIYYSSVFTCACFVLFVLDSLLRGMFHACSSILQHSSTLNSDTSIAVAISVSTYVIKCCYLSMSRLFPNEYILVRCIVLITKCTYSLMLCTILNVHLFYVN